MLQGRKDADDNGGEFVLVGSAGAPGKCPVCGGDDALGCRVDAGGCVACGERTEPKAGYRLATAEERGELPAHLTLYVPLGKLGDSEEVRARKRERDEHEAVATSKGIAEAKAIVASGLRADEAEHALAYVRSRGIDTDNPAVIAAMSRLVYVARHQLKMRGCDLTGPALVGGATDLAAQVVGVQRILLDLELAGAKRSKPDGWPEDKWDCKIARGPITRGCIRLGDIGADGVVILCEGIETGLALVQATGLAVWVCVSTSGLRNVLLPASGVRQVIIAADNDTKKAGVAGPGEIAAIETARMLLERHSGLKVTVVMPSPKVAPRLFDNQAVPTKKGLDWLDVLAEAGDGAVARALINAVDEVDASLKVPAASELSEEDEAVNLPELLGGRGRVLPDGGEVALSRFVLLDMPAAQLKRKPGERWPIVRYAGQWYLWRDGGGERPTAYTLLPDETLFAMVARQAQNYRKNSDGEVGPLNPPKRTIVSICEMLRMDTQVPAGELPMWVQPTFDHAGRPIWDGAGELQEQPVGGGVLAVPEGLLDLDGWLRGEVNFQPHTPRWLSLACSPVKVPWTKVRKVLKDAADLPAEQQIEAVERLAQTMAPQWAAFLKSSLPDQLDRRLLQTYYGYCLTPETRYEKFLAFIGPSGSGKSTAMEPLAKILGKAAVYTMALTDLQNPFALSAIRGKDVVVMPDEAKGTFADMGMIMSVLAKWVGGDALNGDRKFLDRVEFKPTAKLVVSFNELPTMPDAAGKIERRMLPLPFGEAVAAADRRRDLKDQWTPEAPGILLWALAGIRRLKMQDGFVLSSEGQARLSDYQEQNAPVLEFVRDCCELLKDAQAAAKASGGVLSVGAAGEYRVVKQVLHKAYNKWAEANERHLLPPTLFAERLRAAVAGLSDERRGGKGNPKRAREWIGLRLSAHGLAFVDGGGEPQPSWASGV